MTDARAYQTCTRYFDVNWTSNTFRTSFRCDFHCDVMSIRNKLELSLLYFNWSSVHERSWFYKHVFFVLSFTFNCNLFEVPDHWAKRYKRLELFLSFLCKSQTFCSVGNDMFLKYLNVLLKEAPVNVIWEHTTLSSEDHSNITVFQTSYTFVILLGKVSTTKLIVMPTMVQWH